MLVSSASVWLVLVIVSILLFLGEISMSDPLVDSYLCMAIVLVLTIFQVFEYEVLKFKMYFVLKYDPSPTTLRYWIVILCFYLCVLLSIKTQEII